MRAIWLEAHDRPPQLAERPDPEPAAAGAVVAVLAVRVPSYTGQVLDGSLGHGLPLPLVPGPTCIGRVEAVGEDVFDLRPGDICLCNSHLTSGDLSGGTDQILIGWNAVDTPRSRAMQAVWRDGSFAEKAHYPARCLTRLPGADEMDRATLPFLASLAIADGGLARGGLRGGQSVIVTGASGQLGGAAVLLALARGASCVVAAGRNMRALDALAAIDGRVRPVALSGDRVADAAALSQAADGGADLAVDLLGPAPTAEVAMAGIDALRPGGTSVLVGGIREKLPLDYSRIMRDAITVRGSFMFDRRTALECWRLVQSGAIDLAPLTVERFALSAFAAAVERATELGGLRLAVLLPNG